MSAFRWWKRSQQSYVPSNLRSICRSFPVSIIRLIPGFSGNSKIDQKWPEITRSDQEWPEMTRSDQKWPNMTKNDLKWPNMTKNDRKSQKWPWKWPWFRAYISFYNWPISILIDQSDFDLMDFNSIFLNIILKFTSFND